ncbi:MAG: hypothetical protein N3A66_03805, partial [Planctomycetota bacterium]|nr:hypothetical protein [Planctomycetota bacterium]
MRGSEVEKRAEKRVPLMLRYQVLVSPGARRKVLATSGKTPLSASHSQRSVALSQVSQGTIAPALSGLWRTTLE